MRVCNFRDFDCRKIVKSPLKGKLGFRLPLLGSVWSKSFRSRMTRLHGGIKAREIMYGGTLTLGFNPLTELRYALPFHSSFRTGSV